ncbi:MAG TPA: transcriptional regulator GcvA [Usitatibacter sp.]|nr:transcriptional regulator GcvA [Usitatibacter sp.]
MSTRLPPLSALRPFEAAARLESFSRAAEELHLTHGAVSHQVRALEEHLGRALFARHGRRVALNAAGREFAERVRAALGEIAQAADALRPARRDGRLTVSVLPSFASHWLMPRLIRFMEAHPEIEVNVLATMALADFERDEVDVAIRFGRGPWPPLVCEPFLEDEYFPVASPRIDRGRLPRAPRDLLGLRLIREDRDYWPEWFEAAGVALERPVAGPMFNDASLSLQAAVRGEGVALARRSIVGDELARGTLKRLFRTSVPSRERYWFVSPRATAGTARVKAFREWVKSELARR